MRDPHAALRRARELAGPDGAVLATGSIYLVADLVGEPARPEGVGAVNDERGPSVLAMMALVAVVVALVILSSSRSATLSVARSCNPAGYALFRMLPSASSGSPTTASTRPSAC